MDGIIVKGLGLPIRHVRHESRLMAHPGCRLLSIVNGHERMSLAIHADWSIFGQNA